GAIPRLSAAPHSTLHTIGGLPPDLAAPPAGCHFAPRCQYSRELCTSESPRLAPSNSSDSEPNGDANGHRVRCHFPFGETANSEVRGVMTSGAVTGVDEIDVRVVQGSDRGD